MGERTHTPGPWAAKNERGKWLASEPYSVDTDERGVDWSGVCAGTVCVAIVPDDGRVGTEARDANALLIAAAPDLLDACKRASEILRGRGFPGWGIAKDILNEAIAKAEGREQDRPTLGPNDAQLVKRVMAQPADANGWRNHPEDLTREDARALARWERLGWIDLEETPVLRVKEAGERIFESAIAKASPHV